MARLTQVTRKKFYGRSAVAQALRSAIAALDEAIKESERPDAKMTEALQKVQKAVNDAVQADQVYNLEKKQITKGLLEIKKSVDQALANVIGTPILVEERADAKAIRKHNKLFSKDVKK